MATTSTRLSLRDRILQAEDIQTELVEIPEWGCSVAVKSLIAADRFRILDEASTGLGDDRKVDAHKLYIQMTIAGAHDPDTGERLFTKDDAQALSGKAASAIERIAGRVLELSGLTEEARKRLGKDSSSILNGVPSTS